MPLCFQHGDAQSCLGTAIPVSQTRKEPRREGVIDFRGGPHGVPHFLSIRWLEFSQMVSRNCSVRTVVLLWSVEGRDRHTLNFS